MKHTDVTELIKAVKNIEKEDLAAALRQKGGTYTPEPETAPYIEFYGGNGPASAQLVKAALTMPIRAGEKSARIILTLRDDDGGTFCITPYDCYPGVMSALTAEI